MAVTLHHLAGMRLCHEGRQWVKDYSNLQLAWEECTRSDWMLYYIHQCKVCHPDKLYMITLDAINLFASDYSLHQDHELEQRIRLYYSGQESRNTCASMYDLSTNLNLYEYLLHRLSVAIETSHSILCVNILRELEVNSHTTTTKIIRRYFPEIPSPSISIRDSKPSSKVVKGSGARREAINSLSDRNRQVVN